MYIIISWRLFQAQMLEFLKFYFFLFDTFTKRIWTNLKMSSSRLSWIFMFSTIHIVVHVFIELMIQLKILIIYPVLKRDRREKIECSLVLAREQGEIETLGTLPSRL